MDEWPKTTLDFERRFGTEEACVQYLEQLRWPSGFRCPQCGGDKAWKATRGLHVCRLCGHQTSVTAGTIFQDTRKPLRMWFWVIWHLVAQKYGISALEVQRALGLGSYNTAWTWLQKLRRAMVRPGRDRLSGTVEIDESYVGGPRPGKRGRGALGKTLVLIAVEDKGNRIGRIRLRRIVDASALSITPAVEENVEPESVMRTDDWKGYGPLVSKGYGRNIVRRSNETDENLLPLVNRVASLLKRWLLGTHQGAVRPSHLDFYLDEYTFRFNRRTSASRGKLFYRLLEQAVVIKPTRGADLKGGAAALE
jgi:transposase-like protein